MRERKERMRNRERERGRERENEKQRERERDPEIVHITGIWPAKAYFELFQVHWYFLIDNAILVLNICFGAFVVLLLISNSGAFHPGKATFTYRAKQKLFAFRSASKHLPQFPQSQRRHCTRKFNDIHHLRGRQSDCKG